MRLIVNADDFGLSNGVNKGIVKAYRDGIVTSTTLMVNMPFTKEAVELAWENEGLEVGVHLTITAGEPILNGKNSLVNKEGKFYKNYLLYDYTVEFEIEELYEEWKAQIEKFISLMHKKPSHIDSHHHIHLIPKYKEVAFKLGQEYDIPVREEDDENKRYEFVKMIQAFIEDGVCYEFFEEDRANILNEEIIEIMCHPAYVDERLMECSSYNKKREVELEILTSEKIKNWIKEKNISLITYKNIKKIK